MASKANSESENGFFQQVYAIVAQIPKGQALSYGQIAQMLGRPRAARMVGWAMRRCPEELPWHRVVKADGSIAGGGQSELRRGRRPLSARRSGGLESPAGAEKAVKVTFQNPKTPHNRC